MQLKKRGTMFEAHDIANMQIELDGIDYKIEKLGDSWSEKNEIADNFDKLRESIYSGIFLQYRDANPKQSAAVIEAMAKASQQYIGHINSITMSRKEANDAKVSYDALKGRRETLRSLLSMVKEQLKM